MIRKCLVGVLVLTALAGCTQSIRGHGAPWPGPAGPQPVFAPLASTADDGGDQTINDLAAVGSTVVAVGSDEGGGLSRPIFLRSTDAGQTWQAGAVVVGQPDVRSVGDGAYLVRRYRGSWLCFGSASSGYSEWTSHDGLTWTQRRLDPHAFRSSDHIGGVGVTARGLVAVGSVAGRLGRYPQAWTSHDGLTWKRVPGMHRLAVSHTDLWPYGVAAHGRVVVAVGEADQDDPHDDPGEGAMWRSTDAGGTWSRVQMPDEVTNGSSNFNDVRWLNDRFVAVGAGGVRDRGQWSGMSAQSTDGRHWTADEWGPGVASDSSLYLNAVTAVGGKLVVAGDLRWTKDGAFAASGVPLGFWDTAIMPAESGTVGSWVNAAVTVPGGVLLAGEANPHGSGDARIWRSTDGSAFEAVDLGPALTAVRALVTVSSLAADGDRVFAVGASGGTPVVWTSTDGTRYGSATALPHEPRDAATFAAHGPSGWLVLGSHDIGSNGEAIAWTSADGVAWTRSRDGALGRAGEFSSSQLAGATAHGGHWVVVGSHYDDRVTSAQTYRGGGTHWRAGNDTHSGDLHGDYHADRWMSAVVSSGSEVVAVGAAGGPAVWRSRDGVQWRRSALPGPGSAADVVTAHGSRLVVVGTVGSDSAKPYAWVSRDRGVHWSGHAVPVRKGSTGDTAPVAVLWTRSGYVAVASAGPDGHRVTAMWTSPDGARWHAVTVTDPRLHGAGQRTPVTAVAFGGQVVGVATVVSPRSTTPVAFTQRVG